MEDYKMDFSGKKKKKNKNTRAQIAQKKDLDDQREIDVNDWNRGKLSDKGTLQSRITISEVNQLYAKQEPPKKGHNQSDPEYKTVPLIRRTSVLLA